MKKFAFPLFPSLLFAIMVLISCKKEITAKPPSVFAGQDQIIRLPGTYAILFGAAKDPGGKIIKSEWSKVAGPASFNINDATVASTSVGSLIEGKYEFELKVTDNDGLIAMDRVFISVVGPPVPPCVDCVWDY